MNERSQQRIGCLLIDEHPVVREGLRHIFLSTDEFSIAGEAATRDAATDVARRLQPALALVGFPGALGRDTGRGIRAASPRTVIVSFPPPGHNPDPDADAVVPRDADRVALLATIRASLRPADARPPGRASAERTVSPREREVLELLAEGLSNRQISDRLVVSLETIKTHVRNILAKLGADSRAQAVATALRAGLIR